MSFWSWMCVSAIALLLWTWVLYPGAVMLLARLVPRRSRVELTSYPRVTAVLATRDDDAAILARVADFLAADYPEELLDVVVGIDSADSGTIARLRLASATSRVRFVRADAEGGKAAGLNAAVRDAAGDVLIFSDSQQRFAPDAIRVMVATLSADPRLAAVGGALQLPGDRPDAAGRSPVEWYWWMERLLRSAEARLHSSVGLSGSIYAMWRREWVPMPSQLILDDVWLPMRLVLEGHRIGYELDARAWDARSTSAAQEKVRKVRTLTGNFQLVAWLPTLLIPLRNPVWLQFISHKLLRLLTPWMLMLLGVGFVGLLATTVTSAQLLLIAGLLSATLSGAMLVPRLRRLTLGAVRWGWSLQTAVVEATANGLRGRWDVWR